MTSAIRNHISEHEIRFIILMLYKLAVVDVLKAFVACLKVGFSLMRTVDLRFYFGCTELHFNCAKWLTTVVAEPVKLTIN